MAFIRRKFSQFNFVFDTLYVFFTGHPVWKFLDATNLRDNTEKP